MAGHKKVSLSERYWEKVQKTDGCWLWIAQLNNKGYGCFTIKRRDVSKRQYYAHRVAWELEHGPIPDGLKVLHRCDTPACCNPQHLFLGTQLDNIEDRDRKQRVRHGTAHPRAKVTEVDVKAIREDERTQNEIAATYNIHQMTVSDIKRGKTWKHVV